MRNFAPVIRILATMALVVAALASGAQAPLRARAVDTPPADAPDDTDDFGPWPVVDEEQYHMVDTTFAEPPLETALHDSIDLPRGILGEPVIDAETMFSFVAQRNPDFTRDIADAYLSVGRRYGIRGDVALCQAIVETGWFRFADGTAVRPEQHNYCGLGVTRRGVRGHSFDTVELGVTAQLQHLYAYATKEPLPSGERVVDPRFHHVSRGCAPTWHDLSGRWAANDRYGRQIMDVYRKLLQFKLDNPQ